MAALQDAPDGLVRKATLFDVYQPEKPVADIPAGKRSLAVRLELLSDTATLTDSQIDAAVQAALTRAASRIGDVRLRSGGAS